MPSVKGFFLGKWGIVRAQVGVVTVFSTGRWLDVMFKIDTGSSTTLLMDNDFLQICRALGWSFYDYPDLLNWIVIHPSTFEDAGTADCIAGQTGRLYRIQGSIMLLCSPDGSVPKKWNLQGPIYGTFSKGFLSGNWAAGGGSQTHQSLIGIDTLNKLQKMLWSWPEQTIKLQQ